MVQHYFSFSSTCIAMYRHPQSPIPNKKLYKHPTYTVSRIILTNHHFTISIASYSPCTSQVECPDLQPFANDLYTIYARHYHSRKIHNITLRTMIYTNCLITQTIVHLILNAHVPVTMYSNKHLSRTYIIRKNLQPLSRHMGYRISYFETHKII